MIGVKIQPGAGLIMRLPSPALDGDYFFHNIGVRGREGIDPFADPGLLISAVDRDRQRTDDADPVGLTPWRELVSLSRCGGASQAERGGRCQQDMSLSLDLQHRISPKSINDCLPVINAARGRRHRGGVAG